jgi:hypothetical protein
MLLVLKKCPLKAELVNGTNFSQWVINEDIRKKTYALGAGSDLPDGHLVEYVLTGDLPSNVVTKYYHCNCTAMYRVKNPATGGKDSVRICFNEGTRKKAKGVKTCIGHFRCSDEKIENEILKYFGKILDKKNPVYENRKI